MKSSVRVRAWLACLFVTAMSVAPAQADVLVVGQSTALSGPLAGSGEPMRAGAKLHFDAVNAAGGIHGRRIHLISKDDQYKPELTEKNIAELVDKDDAIVLLGGAGTANNEALLRNGVFERAGIAMVGPRTGGGALRKPYNPWMFHIRGSYADEVAKAIEQFAAIARRRVGIVYQNDTFGLDGLRAAEAALARHDLKPEFLASYERSSSEIQKAVDQALHAGTPAILLLTTTNATAAFARQYKAAGGTGQLIALSVNDPAAIIREIGGQAAHGLAVTSVFPATSRTDVPIVKEYRQALARFGPEDAVPSMVGLEGFIAAKVIVEGLRRAGPKPTRAAVLKGLESLGRADIGGFPIAFGPRLRAGSQYVDVMIVNKNGRVIR